jgi:hypothetical protein
MFNTTINQTNRNNPKKCAQRSNLISERFIAWEDTEILKKGLMLHITAFLQRVIESKGELQLEAIMDIGLRGYEDLYESLEHDLGQIE